MISYGEIDYFKKTISIEKQSRIISTEKKKNTVVIDRLVSLWLLEKRIRTVSIDREKYRVISVHIPYFSDWVILQNDYLPSAGEYFLN